jgi:hypothetical protein
MRLSILGISGRVSGVVSGTGAVLDSLVCDASLAAAAMNEGRPKLRFSTGFGLWRLLLTSWKPSFWSDGCAPLAFLILADWTYSTALLASIPFRYAWYVFHSFRCQALWLRPQFAQDTLVLGQSRVS